MQVIPLLVRRRAVLRFLGAVLLIFSSLAFGAASSQKARSSSITPNSLPPAIVYSGYSVSLKGIGGKPPYSWSLLSGALPLGLRLDATQGAITGTARVAGAFPLTIELTDRTGATARRLFKLQVVAPAGRRFDGPAELPRLYVPTGLAATPAPGSTLLVPAGGDLQASLDNARCGDVIQLESGATFTGSFKLPAKPCDDQHWIVIRTSAPDNLLPSEGTRVSPCFAGVAWLPGRPALNCKVRQKALARISFDKGSSLPGPIRLADGANHYRLLGLEITRTEGTGSVGDLISLVTNARADHIVIDRSWLHGVAHEETATGVALRAVTFAAVVDSYFSDFHCTSKMGSCTDAQAIGGGNGDYPMGPYKIVNNFLEASGENILFGGASATTTATDIEIRRNHFFKPLRWMPGAKGFIGGVSGDPFIVKNHFELKNAQRVLFEGNILENNWGGFSQSGKSIVLTPRNPYSKGRKQNSCPSCKVTDVTIRYNTISHVGAGIGIADGLTNGEQARAGERFSIHDLVIDDVDAARFNGGGGLFLIVNSWNTNVLNSISISHVTGFPDPRGHLLTVGNATTNPRMWGLTFTNNLAYTPRYSVWNSGTDNSCAQSSVPAEVISDCFRLSTFQNNLLFSDDFVHPPSDWPPDNSFATASGVDFVDYKNGNGGDYHLSPNSSYKKAGSDRKDPGADIDAVQAAVAGVY